MEIFGKQERRKSKYKFGGTKVCKAEEVRKCFVNHKIESFSLVCKLDWISDIHYVWISDIQKQSVRQDIGCFMWKYGILVKIRVSLLYVTNRCIKVTCKLILPSVSRFKFCPYYKSRVKLIFI